MKIMNKTAMRAASIALCLILAGGFFAANITALAENAVMPNQSAKNAPPIAESIELTTFRNIAITERFIALDPDGDILTFEITKDPKKGSVTVMEDGSFVYTPKEGFKGKDSFVYVAVDSAGNVSAEATVKISVKKQATKTTYADMEGNSAAYAALVLAEKGIFTGEALGGEHFFKPEQTVTRGEFLAMCLNACGADTLTGVTRTGFHDDGSTPLWVKPYVSTALMSGVISGYKDTDGKLVFSACEPITYSEAAVILDNILDTGDVISVAAVQSDPEIPVWAYTATVNLSSNGIIPEGVSDMYNDTVTRADAAKMLLASYELIESGGGGTLLSWAK